MLAILDYGMANLRSVQKAFQRLGHEAAIISRPSEVRQATKLVVPGVGAFKDAIARLNAATGEGTLAEAIRGHILAEKPFLGICLGLQLLADSSTEDGEHAGMGIVPGRCVRFTVDRPPMGLKVPHMGWNSLDFRGECPLFRNLPAKPYVYFVHSYFVEPRDAGMVAATAEYGGAFTAALWNGRNLYATQFHPEKSQEVGGVILGNFAGM